jgi:hypothetical protein
MGLLNLFNKTAPDLVDLPSGSLTVARDGDILASTLPSNFPENLVQDIAQHVLASFLDAAEAQLPLEQLVINYPSLKITARELRGGAMLFFSPSAPCTTSNSN